MDLELVIDLAFDDADEILAFFDDNVLELGATESNAPSIELQIGPSAPPEPKAQ